jgi:hypothetical protein
VRLEEPLGSHGRRSFHRKTPTLRDHLRSVKAEAQGSTTQRKEMMAAGEELFSRLSLGLRSAFGSKSDRLAAFTVKPRKTGRPSKPPVPAPPATEVTAAPASEATKGQAGK